MVRDPTDPLGVQVQIREARVDDVPAIDALVRELARYEREPDAVVATVEDLQAALFGADPVARCLLAEEVPASDVGRSCVVGFALWFVTYSTWTGRPGIWLEDLFVAPDHRGTGAGRALLTRLAATCVERGYARLEWNVLDWNEPALGFYQRLGAEALDTWTVHRLSGPALHELAAGAGGR